MSCFNLETENIYIIIFSDGGKTNGKYLYNYIFHEKYPGFLTINMETFRGLSIWVKLIKSDNIAFVTRFRHHKITNNQIIRLLIWIKKISKKTV